MSKVEAEPRKIGANTDIEVVDSEAKALDSRAIECTRGQEMGSTEEDFDKVDGAAIVEVFESFQEDFFNKIEPSTNLTAENNNDKEDSLPLETQHQNTEPLKAAHQIQNSNAKYSAKEEKMKKVESVAEEFSRHSQAHIVELLGELVIGEEANDYFRSIKRRRVLYSELKNDSNHLFTQMISQSKAPLVEYQLSKVFTTISSLRCGGFFIKEEEEECL